MESDSSSDSFLCAHCGAELAPSARFCRSCGASEDSGWQSESTEEWAEEQEQDFDYDAFVAREFADQTGDARQLIWVLVALAALFTLFASLVLGR